MSSRKGKIYNDSRFHDDYDTTIDQEFGRNENLLEQNSGFIRSSTSYFRDVNEKVEGSEAYIHSSPGRTINPKINATPMTEGGLDKFTNMIKKEIKAHPPKYLGPELRTDLIKAAELKLGTKVNQPKSLFEFWSNHIKKRGSKMIDMVDSKLLSLRPASAKMAAIPESKKPQPAVKNAKVKELDEIYAKYENCRGMDVRLTLMQENDRFNRTQEENKKTKELMMKKSQDAEKENAVKREINEFFKRYTDFKIRDNTIELDRKRVIITRIRDRKARSASRSKSQQRSMSRSASPQKARSQSAKRNQIQRSPIKLEGSLEDIEESKMESVSEEKPSPPKEKLLNKIVRMTVEEKEFTEEEVQNFDYDREVNLMKESLKILEKVSTIIYIS